ncbi:hypothetical protein SDC9_158785 [bioreactor metagenome]|uniref:Helix-turn-helix domain-containing protein n=1 Tax=bioreactor metagenome TaxID=1076179 RepID=A0A645FDF1_9ZZZZ
MNTSNKICSIEELPLTVSVDDLTAIFGIGRSAAYALVRSGQIRSITIGRKIRIPKDGIRDFLNGNQEAC